MSNFRGRAPSGLINRKTGNYAYLGENGEIIVDGPTASLIMGRTCWLSIRLTRASPLTVLT